MLVSFSTRIHDEIGVNFSNINKRIIVVVLFIPFTLAEHKQYPMQNVLYLTFDDYLKTSVPTRVENDAYVNSHCMVRKHVSLLFTFLSTNNSAVN